uniref:hypothetical protein n=1 Tax=Ornithobacterium rhinotracheale TaxID=28251 RepID=UPI00129CEA8A|nr:hypothetical protein [Ornithobacterium rhinotracheale]
MKKKEILFLLFFLMFVSLYSQNKFRVDYNYVSFYDERVGNWSKWEKGDNTFVININDRGDIAHLEANGETVIYRKLSGVEEGTTSDGHHYQIIKALDGDGDVFTFQLFDERALGLKLMYGNFLIQFAYLPQGLN